jgi:hypothetical protein
MEQPLLILHQPVGRDDIQLIARNIRVALALDSNAQHLTRDERCFRLGQVSLLQSSDCNNLPLATLCAVHGKDLDEIWTNTFGGNHIASNAPSVAISLIKAAGPDKGKRSEKR